MYSNMAHFVGAKLHMRPSSILDEWCVPELIVAYGVYVNELSQENFEKWKSMDTKSRAGIQKPEKYIVKFIEV